MALDLNQLRETVRQGRTSPAAPPVVPMAPLQRPSAQRVPAPPAVEPPPPVSVRVDAPGPAGTVPGAALAVAVVVVLIGLLIWGGSSNLTKPAPAPLSAEVTSAPSPVEIATLKNPLVKAPLVSAPPVVPRASGIPLDEIIRVAETANIPGIEQVMSTARSGTESDIEAAAVQAGRSFSFDASTERDRKIARALNQQALDLFNSGNYAAAHATGENALRADPLDTEVAGNLAIYALRQGDAARARQLAIYALSLPRNADKTGRTADWNTLSAAFAQSNDMQKAREAIYVTLAIAPNVGRRCKSAVHSVRNTYGDVMRAPTEAMFERVRERGLSSEPDCAMPISW
jgi:hypothetical protein